MIGKYSHAFFAITSLHLLRLCFPSGTECHDVDFPVVQTKRDRVVVDELGTVIPHHGRQKADLEPNRRGVHIGAVSEPTLEVSRHTEISDNNSGRGPKRDAETFGVKNKLLNTKLLCLKLYFVLVYPKGTLSAAIILCTCLA